MKSPMSANLQRLPVKIALMGFLITALLAGVVAFAILDSRRSVEIEWSNRLAAFTTMMSAHAAQSIGAADLVLRSITDDVQGLVTNDQDSLRRNFSTQKTFDMLRAAAGSVPQIDVATIVALNGDVINFTRSYPPPQINLADRDYFQAHINDPSLDVFLSIPVQNRGDGGWTFYLARKIRGRNGEMVGLVLTGLFSDFFADFYKSVSLGPQQAMSIYRSDGRLLARYPVARAALGASFAESATFIEALRGGEQGVAITGAARVTNAEDNETRMIAARRDAHYPIVVATNTSQSIYLQQWRQNVWVLAIAGFLLCLVLAGATVLTTRLVQALERARTEALSAVAAKSRFVSTVSHELRTPLSAIVSGSAQLLDHKLTAEPLKLAVLVSRSAQHLLLLINDILQFSRFEAGKETVLREPFGIRDVVADVLEIARSLPRAERLALSGEVDAHTPVVLLGDRGRLTQILLNLVGNAVKYTPAGAVHVQASYCDGELRIAVRDTGPGISPADQARIFEPFERTGAVREVAGTGLGLSICRRLADLMHGSLQLESELRKGSTFTLRLPMRAGSEARGRESAADGRPEHFAARTGALRVLLAEDSASIRMLMMLQLRKEGFEVTAVSNGREALDSVRKCAPDFVLMDIQMPEMDGLEATREIRKLPADVGRVPIIAITAFADEAVLSKAIAIGMNAAICKPLNMADLKMRLSELSFASPPFC